MKHLLLHPHTKTNVAQFVASPSHALLLVGSNGMGKAALASAMAAEILDVGLNVLDSYPYFKTTRTDKNSISIDSIRELQRFLQLKTVGTRPFRRAVIVEHAETMTIEAQNAYLKLLEEPPSDTIMILTADNQQGLLPTILSRTQQISIYAPDETALKDFFSSTAKDSTAVNQAYLLSGGLPGLMHALLSGEDTHPLVQGVATAKEVLQKQTFERLVLAESLSKQKDEAKCMLDALQHIAQTMLDGAAIKEDSAKLKQWHRILKAAAEAKDALAANVNVKLVLDRLMLVI